ncbi:MAG: hypothetical protein U0802_02305 [Candidatus Binatia bacterium]
MTRAPTPPPRAGAASPAPAELMNGPTLYPVSLDFERRTATVVAVTRERFCEVGFHGPRNLDPDGAGARYDLSALLADPPVPDPDAPPLHYVLHMGLCCSTLLGRALDRLPGVFCLREPTALNELTMWIERAHDAAGHASPWQASAEAEPWLRLLHFLLQRGYRGGRGNVVKTLPQTALIAPWLLERDERSRALYLYVDPTTFLCQTLRSRRRRTWVRGCLRFSHADWRASYDTLSDCEAAAMTWATRMEQYRRLRRGPFGARVRRLDGGRLVVDRAPAFGEAVAALALPCDANDLARVLADPLWAAHAKGPARAYDAYDRQDLLERVRLRCRSEIQRGLEWLAANVPWFAPERPAFGADDGAA